jgi:hypothetical protein
MQQRRNRLQELPIKMQLNCFEFAVCGVRPLDKHKDAQTCGQEIFFVQKNSYKDGRTVIQGDQGDEQTANYLRGKVRIYVTYTQRLVPN